MFFGHNCEVFSVKVSVLGQGKFSFKVVLIVILDSAWFIAEYYFIIE